MRSADEIDRVADRLNAAVAFGDEALQREVFSDNFRVWHNADQQELDREAAIKSIASVRARLASVEHTDVRRLPTPAGYVEECIVHMRTHAGAEVANPTCLVVEVDPDGRIGSVREYADSARLAPLFGDV